jgi:hypothetical protein
LSISCLKVVGFEPKLGIRRLRLHTRLVHVTSAKSDNASEFRGAASRKLLTTILSTLRITDLIALMMVLVTALTAYATWKTAQVTNEILLTSQRPYVGVESVNLIDATSPKVVVDLRNFGGVQAEHAVIGIVLRVNGKALPLDPEPQQQLAPVVLSPAVPHRFYRHLSADIYRDAVQGKADLVVEVRVRYRGPRGDEHCYLARHRYDPIDDIFYPQGGSLSCDQGMPLH